MIPLIAAASAVTAVLLGTAALAALALLARRAMPGAPRSRGARIRSLPAAQPLLLSAHEEDAR